MPRCGRCNEMVFGGDMVGDLCADCHDRDNKRAEAAAQVIATTAARVTLSMETVLVDMRYERLGIATGTCVLGQHIGKDLLAALRDVVGGRARKVEDIYNDARERALEDLKLQAALRGGNMVIAIQFTHQDISTSGGMAFVTASGTVIRCNDGLESACQDPLSPA